MAETPSKAVQAKAAKYLLDARVNVVEADDATALISVRGTEVYEVIFSGIWTCSCPAQTYCAHILAASTICKRAPVQPKISTSDDDEIAALLS